MRHAVYFTPAADDPLTRAASAWLGRDAFSGEAVERRAGGAGDDPLPADIAGLTEEPRRYGFHATVVAPFRLAAGADEAALREALDAFCATREPFSLRLKPGRLGSFLALVPEGRSAALERLAGDAVEHFAHLRAPLTPGEIERRRPQMLSERQRQLLMQWGYPYVMEEFRFHMTLTGPLPADRIEDTARAVAARFGPLLARPVTVGALAIFSETGPGGPFLVSRLAAFGATAKRKSA